MNAIDPSNNYGGGKVKFFAGGSGGGGQTIRLLPIMIGSNNATTISEGGMIPLNTTTYFNDGGDGANEYDDSILALSYLPQIDNPYYYYLTTGVIQAVGSNNVQVDLDLIIDGVVIETIGLVFVAGNSYTSLFDFTQTPQLNQYPVERYGIRITQTSGASTKFLINTTNVFLSVYDENELKSEFFTSSNLNGLEIVGSDSKFFGFGGQTNANSSGAIPLVRCVVGDTLFTELWKVYFILSQNVDVATDFISVQLYIDDNLIEQFQVSGDIPAYTPQEFALTTPTEISSRGNTYIRIYNSSDLPIYLFEVGICGYELLD
jgi:hypothetical protein